MLFLKLLLLSLVITVSLFSSATYSLAVKEKKIYPMGKKIYTKRCSKIDVGLFKTYDSLYKSIFEKKLCGKLNAQHAQAVSIYLWDRQSISKHLEHYKKLVVTKKDKCPVCGMFLYKYPRWVARIEYADKNVSFDGVKDMMKYYFNHKKGIKVLLVQEYYTQKTINAKKAYFVLDSDVYGPMGNELIPFKNKKSAKTFLLNHKAKRILRFDKINEDDVYKLDE